MSAPDLQVYVNGGPPISGDGLNTFVGWCPNIAVLRGFIGVDTMTIYLQGTSVPNDGGQGSFYWNSTATNADDNGITTVIPSGSSAGNGEWIRLGSEGTLTSLTVTDLAGSGTRAIEVTSTGLVQALTGAPITKINPLTITSSGNYNPTAGTLFSFVKLLGGGAGGGGCSVAPAYGSAGGGGAGAYSEGIFTAAQLGATVSVVIGAAGTSGGSSGTAGGNGGTSSFGSLIINVAGGTGGLAATSIGANAGGAGGTAGSGGYINIAGMHGGNGVSSSAGTIDLGGIGGSANPFGAGGYGGANSAGGSATGFGSGGGGATGQSASNVGGVGSGGLAVILEFISA